MNRSLKLRLVGYFITFIFILTFNFFIPRLMPGDPFTFVSSDDGYDTVTYSTEEIELYKKYYGMDKPLYSQYFNYLANTLTGNLGYSIYFHDSVTDIIFSRMWWTIGLVATALLLSSFIGVLLGSISAWKRNNKTDYLLYLSFLTVSEIPAFLIGIIFLFILGANLGWFPLSGGISSFAEYNSVFDKFLDIVNHAALPVLTLTVVGIGSYYILARNSMISVLSKDYIQTARAKGLTKKRQIFRHALRNSILPIITRIFLSLGGMFGGAILVENVFKYPGLGLLIKDSVLLRDYPLIQGIFLFVTLLVLAMNLIADVLYKKLDPRVN